MKNRHPAGSGQAANLTSTIPASDRQRLLSIPSIRPHLIRVGYAKRPTTDAWQLPGKSFSDGELCAAPAIGLRLGYPICAVDFDPKPQDLGQAERTFEKLTGRSSAELPTSWTVTSGKPGRRQVLLEIPEEHAAQLRPWSRDALEFRWRGQQSVIDGHHPETGRYRWLPGRAPWECPLAPAPTWLLEGIHRVTPRAIEYKPTPLPRSALHVAPRPAAVIELLGDWTI